jgi:hypothetical protein
LDGNFKLKLKERGIKDVDVGSGLAYFVKDDMYTEYLHIMPEQADVSALVLWPNAAAPHPDADLSQIECSCASTHRAVSSANSKSGKGYAVTGVVTVKCARHGFVLPNGVADLQKGEK